MKRLILFPAALIAALLCLSLHGPAQVAAEDEMDIAVMIETADSPADHLKIAEYYEEQAVILDGKAEVYEAMVKAYEQRSKMPGLAYHSQKLAKEAKLSAEQYRAMAEEHKKMAQGAGSHGTQKPQ